MKQSAQSAVLLGLLCSLLTGCFDTKQEITLNPDGRGKVIIESTFAEYNLLSKNDASSKGERSITETIRHLIETSRGVDAWRDVTFEELEDGRLRFKGTAYFPDLNQLRLPFTPQVTFTARQVKKGEWSLSLSPDRSEAGSILPSLTGTNTPEAVRRQRKEFRAAQPFLTAMLGTMSCETTLHLAGAAQHSTNFERLAPKQLRLRFSGRRAAEALERLFDPAFDTRWGTTNSRTSSVHGDHLLNEILYGERGPIVATFVPDKQASFDYEAEVAAAHDAFRPVAEKLALTEGSLTPVKPIIEGTPAKVEVTGMEWRFGGVNREYTLSLHAEFPGAVLHTDDAEVTRATTLEGASLLKGTGQGTVYHSGSGLQTNVSFDIRLLSPSPESKGIAEISGHLICRVANDLRAVELISGSIWIGSKSSNFETSVDEVMRVGNDKDRFVIRTRLAPEQLLSLTAVDAKGVTTRLERQGMMNVGGVYTYTFLSQRTVPRTGKLIARVISGTNTVRVPFTVTNLALSGHALARR